ncbi:SICA antigen [Plasmodium coatneyi]|uniref:SICA antigen n=1 Tax=Plasmodium coatneyi TaxID=208452 RepID=A0A1B1DSE0_9APIC|nr:SICA antigen [Plasmodium coatneyi]ANQ05693.1 SICA antigen [Plasmodium coatneyi]
MDHGMDHSGPHEYTLVKERKQPRSVPTRTERTKKLGVGRRSVGRRTIIDIHLEVLEECQKGDLHSTKQDFFEILVQEFMGSKFIKEEKVPSSDSGFRFQVQIAGFREEDFVPMVRVAMEDVPKEQFPSSDFGFREEDFVPKEGVSTEQGPSSDSEFMEDDFVPKEQVQSSDSGFREEDFVPGENLPYEHFT